MRIFEYYCDDCHGVTERESRETVPIGTLIPCACCDSKARRVFSVPRVPPDSLSLDPDHIDPKFRVASDDGFGIGEKAARRREKAYQADIAKKRAMFRDGGNQNKGLKMTHSVPPDLYHGKIRETGDKQYWSDPKNRNKHKSTRVV